nr:hypothetical protein [Kutzneria sp. 744]
MDGDGGAVLDGAADLAFTGDGAGDDGGQGLVGGEGEGDVDGGDLVGRLGAGGNDGEVGAGAADDELLGREGGAGGQGGFEELDRGRSRRRRCTVAPLGAVATKQPEPTRRTETVTTRPAGRRQ